MCQKAGGRPRDDLAPGLRTVPFEKSVIIAYTIEGISVWITNIFYGGRDYEALYRGASPKDDET
jgi:toxin ParE1/3/4